MKLDGDESDRERERDEMIVIQIGTAGGEI